MCKLQFHNLGGSSCADFEDLMQKFVALDYRQAPIRSVSSQVLGFLSFFSFLCSFPFYQFTSLTNVQPLCFL